LVYVADRHAPFLAARNMTIQVLITSHGVMFGERVARLVMAESLTDNPDLEID
jgi:hypothetical protein